MKKIFLSGLLTLASAGSILAQNELSNFTATGRGGVINTFASDYQVLGINPANLGRANNATFAFSIGEFGAGVSSQSLTHEQLNKFIYHPSEKLDSLQKREFAAAFNNEDAFNLNVDIATFSASARIPKIGGIAIGHRIRTSAHMGLNQNAAEILFLGKDAPVFQNIADEDSLSIRETLADSEIKMQILSEWNVAYGTRLVDLPGFKLHAGAGYKYIQGVGVVEIVVNSDEITAYSALSPIFNVDYGAFLNNPRFNTTDIGGGVFKPVGKGHGFDVGLSAEIGETVLASVAVTDIGNIKWKGNLLTANDEYIQKVTSQGINSFNFFEEILEITGTGTDSLFRFVPDSEMQRNLPTKLRTGVGFKFTEKLEAGLDATIPLNNVAGNLADPFVGLGVDFKALPFLKLSSGFSAGAGYGASIPLGFTVVTPVYEFGVATRDISGLFSNDNPYLSVAFGFLRFKFGTPAL